MAKSMLSMPSKSDFMWLFLLIILSVKCRAQSHNLMKALTQLMSTLIPNSEIIWISGESVIFITGSPVERVEPRVYESKDQPLVYLFVSSTDTFIIQLFIVCALHSLVLCHSHNVVIMKARYHWFCQHW